MRTSAIAAAVMALASAVSAQVDGFAVFSTPKAQEVVPAGKPYALKWVAGAFSGKAVLSLIGGETQPTQQFIANLTTIEVGANGFTWDVDCSLGKAKVYGLTITLVEKPTTFQWSQPFRIDNSGCAGQSSSSASASSSAAVYPTASASSSAAVYPTASVSSTKVVTQTSTAAPTTIVTKSTTESHAAQTSSSTKAPTTPVPTTTGGTTIPTAAAGKVAAGSFALAGAAVAAVLAL
ncbi:hypothetical protein Micbo1qcDRAFT_158106 [Microdochium bolleyi]|uniref:Yeast cell wall synthesis Kre9/Knh1-like N-terminal domain-containing protein n=1 Tax=Microdochium bolleyi TaxID=196109 RepID=A0A136JFR9_9PEZI|nr:hypothetical protein Micbo1qcDRAFT_158106 [Microdochium bolleyi]